MDLQLALILFVLGLGLWTFLPDSVTRGLGPLVHAAAGAVRALARAGGRAGYRLLCWVFDTPPVRLSQEAPTALTSSASGVGLPDRPSDPQTDADRPAQTAVLTPTPEARRAAMLDICRALRAAGYGREEARAVLRGAGLSLDNNLWTEAAPPPPEATRRTPIADRPTAAEFQQPA